MDAVDGEILAVRAQIDALRQRQSLLSTSLLSSNRTKALISRQTISQPHHNSRKQQQNAVANVAKAIELVSASTIRTTTGITSFQVKDPDPHADADGKVFGIRLDVFSYKRHCFESPYFLLFRQIDAAQQLKLHQHTIPTFVPIRSLIQRYLSLPSADRYQNHQGRSKQNVAAFARAVRRELIAYTRRRDMIATLEEKLAVAGRGQSGIQAINSIDPSSRNLDVHLRNDATIRIRLDFLGSIEKYSIATRDALEERSKIALERVLANHTVQVDSLVETLEQLK